VPGLIGFTKNYKYGDPMLLRMRELLRYFKWYQDDVIYSDEHICASRIHLGIIDQAQQPYNVNNHIYSWLEGELYNHDELEAKYDVASVNDNELLLNIYFKTKSFDFLKDVDGYYAAVIYDKVQNTVYLITDRYGFKPLYWGRINGSFSWSSELKGFLGHEDIKIKIDAVAVEQFFNVGYLLENRTWFEGIELMPPAAILEFNIMESEAKITHYWSWSEIKPLKEAIDEKEISFELGRLFKQAVRKRMQINERIGITLSGGLDSRAILAAASNAHKPLHTFTFGLDGCDDMVIAKKAAAIKGAVHHDLHINSNNWLTQRIGGVWKTDGLQNLMHMHGVEFSHDYRSHIDINLNGFAGDLVLGVSYLTRNHFDRKIDSNAVTRMMKSKSRIHNFADWYLIDKTDPYFINNRVRRFTNNGLIHMSKSIEQRMPFFSNRLIEYVYSLPDILRYKSRIYRKLLLSEFPEYFISIPWQKTGCPITYPYALVRVINYRNLWLERLKRKTGRISIKYTDLHNYTDYAKWLRQEPAKSFFKSVLFSKSAIYPEYIDQRIVRNQMKDHLEEKSNYHEELCLVLTFELWLQQVFEGLYRQH